MNSTHPKVPVHLNNLTQNILHRAYVDHYDLKNMYGIHDNPSLTVWNQQNALALFYLCDKKRYLTYSTDILLKVAQAMRSMIYKTFKKYKNI